MQQVQWFLSGNQVYTANVYQEVTAALSGGPAEVWLTQTQNGNLQYDGPYAFPMGPYTLQPNDVGFFNANVFALVNGQKGEFIGEGSFECLAGGV